MVLPTLISCNAVHYITLLLPVLNTVCTANGQMYASTMSKLKRFIKISTNIQLVQKDKLIFQYPSIKAGLLV